MRTQETVLNFPALLGGSRLHHMLWPVERGQQFELALITQAYIQAITGIHYHVNRETAAKLRFCHPSLFRLRDEADAVCYTN